MSLPCAAVPLPSGRPVPSGATEMSQALTSSGVGARPTPYFGAWAKSAAAAKASSSALHIAHTSVGGDFPDRDAVVVVLRIGAAGLDQRLAGGLHVAGFVSAAGL